MPFLRNLLAALCLIATLTGCITNVQRAVGEARGADELKNPLSIGPGPHENKRSPCACIRIPLLGPPLPEAPPPTA